MGKKSPKAPAAPDPNVTAAAQGGWNSFTAQQQQAMNMVGQNSPYGTLDYTQTGTTTILDPNGRPVQIPQYTANVKLTPGQQAIFDQTQEAEGNLAELANSQSEWLQGYLGKATDTSGLPALQSTYAGADDFSADRQRVEDALFSRLTPQLQQDEDRLRTQLINSGIRPGTPAYTAEMARLGQARNDARQQVVLGAGQEQNRLVGLARDAASFGNAARGQGFSEVFQERNQPLNELLAIMSGSQIENPTSAFAQTPQSGVSGVDYTGLVNQQYQSKLAQWQSDVQNRQNTMGGLFNLGKAAIGLFSDRRLKTDIRRVGTLDNGIPIYVYRMGGQGPYLMGVMAQEAAEVRPDAVVQDASGYLKVRYDLVVEAA